MEKNNYQTMQTIVGENKG